MIGKTIAILIIHLVISVFVDSNEAQSQDVKSAGFNYISPVPGSKYIMPQSNIAIRHGDLIQVESMQNFSIRVIGSKSGKVTGKTILSDDLRTIIFKPDNSFAFGEEVQVIIYEGLKTITGLEFEQKEFAFTITSSIPDLPANYFFENEFRNAITQKRVNKNDKSNNSFQVKNNNLPEDFPEITINLSENLPHEGYYSAYLILS